MKKTVKTYKAIIAASACVSALCAIPSAMAQEDDEVVVTGVRGLPRSVQDSPVPIDVFSEGDLEGVSYTDVNDVLLTLVPSYTLSRQPISDGSSFIRPASLRGLPTDKTLVLVNSKRRHRAALVSIGGSGTQGPDVATIPAVALKSVEVLRDGAAAQYGSDAIAGVIN
ncbi:MAG: TonB-dependent receptor plug domain-containing protein, partial [Oricola sp.]|nr:TonB-dependent receptor plug domain-containing protein [Oricola sp.]